jgi:hypothetical protein
MPGAKATPLSNVGNAMSQATADASPAEPVCARVKRRSRAAWSVGGIVG